MSVTRQTVSRWESDEVVPELDRLVEMCGVFACKLASYVIVSSDPESDALGHMDRWAESCGLKKVCPDVKFIGWDFPFVSQEQQHRFGLHGYVAACVLPDDFKTDCSGVMFLENKEADYGIPSG